MENMNNLGVNTTSESTLINEMNKNIEKIKAKEYFQLLSKLFLSNTGKLNTEIEENQLHFIDNYPFLLFGLLVLLKENNENIHYSIISTRHGEIRIKKQAGNEFLSIISNLFSELTLQTLYFMDNDLKNEWVAEMQF